VVDETGAAVDLALVHCHLEGVEDEFGAHCFDPVAA